MWKVTISYNSLHSHTDHILVFLFHDARDSFNMMILRAEPGYNPNLKMHLLVFVLCCTL